MEETNYISIQEEIDGLELLLSVYDKSDSKYIDIEETINGLTELQELYKTEELVYKPKIVTDGDSYKYLTKPSERYNVEELKFLYKLLETMVEDKQFKRLSAKELKTKLGLIYFEITELKQSINKYGNEISYALLWYNTSIGLKSLKYNIPIYTEYDSNISLDDFLIEFNRMPFEQKKVITIKRRGNFLTNKDEIKLVKSFAGKDDLRPAMKMINTQDDYAVSTDANTLVGLYDKNIGEKEVNYDLINGTLRKNEQINVYPKWKNIIPLPHQLTNKISIDLVATHQYLKKCIEYEVINTISYTLPIKIDGDKIFEVNGRFMISVITYFIKLGFKEVYMNFSELKSKPILFTTNENTDVLSIKQDFAILMPLMYQDDNSISLDYISNKQFEIGGKIKNKKSSVDLILQERRGI